MGKLVLYLADGTLLHVPLDKERITIGRRADNDVCLPYPAVSGEHAAVVTILADSFLEDLGSTNGTLVNGKAAGKHFLNDNDQIDIGRQRLVYLADDDARVDPLPPDMVRNQLRGLSDRVESVHAAAPLPMPSINTGRAMLAGAGSPMGDELEREFNPPGRIVSAPPRSPEAPGAVPAVVSRRGDAVRAPAETALAGVAEAPAALSPRQVPRSAPVAVSGAAVPPLPLREETAAPPIPATTASLVRDTPRPARVALVVPAPAESPAPPVAEPVAPASPPPALPSVRVLSGPSTGRSVPFPNDKLTLGRVGIQVAVVHKLAAGYRLVPLEGAEPPRINGAAVPADGAPLHPGDTFEVAGVRLELAVGS